VVYGEDEGRRIKGLEATFFLTLRSLKRPALSANLDGKIVGVVAFARPGQCFFKQLEARRKTFRIGKRTLSFSFPQLPIRGLLPLLSIGSTGLRRMSAWTEVTAKHDPAEAHQHIELVAVAPELQRRGIGARLMERVLEEMKASPAMPYLETNSEDDVRFYERLGFEILDQAEVMDVTIRFMGRKWGDASTS